MKDLLFDNTTHLNRSSRRRTKKSARGTIKVIIALMTGLELQVAMEDREKLKRLKREVAELRAV